MSGKPRPESQADMLVRLMAIAGQSPTAGMVPPGPPPGTPPSLPPPGAGGAGPSMRMMQPSVGVSGQAGGGELIPAPNSAGGLTPQQAQIFAAMAKDPILVETFVNVIMASKAGDPRQQQQPIERTLFG